MEVERRSTVHLLIVILFNVTFEFSNVTFALSYTVPLGQGRQKNPKGIAKNFMDFIFWKA